MVSCAQPDGALVHFRGAATTWTVESPSPREGGQAWVYRASDGRRTGAVKVAKAAGEWMARERAVLERLGHEEAPWVVRLLDHGRTDDGLDFLVLEWFDASLDDWLATRPPLEAVLEALQGAAEAVARLHAAAGLRDQLLHLDVKPANLLVRPGAGGPRVVLADLGGVKHGRLLAATRFLGDHSPGFAPLEQELALDRPPDPSMDTHALAATVYAALCRRLPDARLAPPPLLPPGRRLDELQRLPTLDDAEARERDELSRLPVEALVALDGAVPLTPTDEARLRNRLADALAGRCAAPDAVAERVAAGLLPVLRAALAPDPRLREKRVTPLFAALADAREEVQRAVTAGGDVAAAGVVSPPPSHASGGEGSRPTGNAARPTTRTSARTRSDARPHRAAPSTTTAHPLIPRGSTAAQAIHGYLERAARRGERSVGRTRLVLLAAAFVSELFVHSPAQWASGAPSVWASTVVIVAGAAASAALLRGLARGADATRLTWASVALDAALVTGVSLPAAVWPPADYAGQFHLPSFAFFLVAIGAAALRMSRPVLRFAIGCNVAGALLLLGIDATTRAATQPATAQQWVLWAAAFLGAAFVADAGAVRTRRMVYEAAGDALEVERTRQVLGAYVSEEVAAELLDAGAGLRGTFDAGGRRQAVAVLFCDLRGFTRYASTIAPEQLLVELNAYLAVMVDAATGRGGVVDKFLGDGLMVVFGVPHPAPDAASRAVLTAADMLGALDDHNEQRVARGQPPLECGIGIHAGEGVVGNVGTPERMEYTVVGEVVNLASRLQSATRELGVEVLVSDTVARTVGVLTGDVQLAPRGLVSLRGLTEPVAVWTFD